MGTGISHFLAEEMGFTALGWDIYAQRVANMYTVYT